MDIKNQADFDKILVLCRKRGVKSLKISAETFEVELLAEVPPSNYKKKQELGSDKIEIDQIYDEDAALFWSSAGLPTEKEAV